MLTFLQMRKLRIKADMQVTSKDGTRTPASRLTVQYSHYGQCGPSFQESTNIFVAEIIKMQEAHEVLLSSVAEQHRAVLHSINIKDFIPGVS